MFKQPTVFILGAGASNEFDMPVGADLTAGISQDVYYDGLGNQDLLQHIRKSFPAPRADDLIKCGVTLSRIAPHFPSMDEALHYLSDNPDVVEIGKLAIAYRILKAEEASYLAGAIAGRADKDKIECERSWASKFLGMAVGQTRLVNICDVFKHVTIIDFNYDRVLPQYLYVWLQRNYGVSGNAAAEAVSRLRILHPYGCLGPLEWQRDGANRVPFASRDFSLSELAKGIKTYTEESASSEVDQIRVAIKQAVVVIILGFGFHNQNVELLFPSNAPARPIDIFMTVIGIHEDNHPRLRSKMQTILRSEREPQLMQMKSCDLLAELRTSIMFAAG